MVADVETAGCVVDELLGEAITLFGVASREALVVNTSPDVEVKVEKEVGVTVVVAVWVKVGVSDIRS